MKTAQKFIFCAALMIANILPFALKTKANQGHHQSGIISQVTGLPTFVTDCTVRIVSSDGGKFLADIPTDGLRFEVSLKPGVYTLVANPVSPVPNLFMPPGTPIVVRIAKKELVELELVYMPQPQ